MIQISISWGKALKCVEECVSGLTLKAGTLSPHVVYQLTKHFIKKQIDISDIILQAIILHILANKLQITLHYSHH